MKPMLAKVKRTYMLEAQTAERIERLARETKRTRSAVVDLALDMYYTEECNYYDNLVLEEQAEHDA